MARAKAKVGKAAGTPRATRRSTRTRQSGDAPTGAIPDVFHDMLSEAAPDPDDDSRPSKKRKVGEAAEEPILPSTPSTRSTTAVDRGSSNGPEDDAPRLQIIIDDSESDYSDMDWEDVDLDQQNTNAVLPRFTKAEAEETLQIEIGNDDTKNKPARTRRKAATAAERAVRLHIHKMHVLCLLFSSHIRNAWCNDDKVQSSLSKFRSTQIIKSFTPDPSQSQLAASKAFSDGLILAKEAWRKFKITALGMRRARWAQDTKELEIFKITDISDPVMDISDFRKAAVTFEGSAETGAMLFCAFLRALKVDARLICSLQPLPFAGAQPTTESPAKDQGKTVYADDHTDAIATPTPDSKPLRRITRVGRPGLNSSSSRQAVTPSPVKPKKTIPHPRYPVFWVEAFNPAQQKWVTVDPIATDTIAKPSRLEPPLSDPHVSMAYVVAFEGDSVAKDVTRRYAKAYNAKTRKSRVESTGNGNRWWRRAMRLFRRRATLDRDQVEDAELSRREAQEEMPKNVQDFKDHPYYVLERHLKHNEVIHPKRECGQVNVGSAANTNLESIYRRRDVHQLKSADKWYRLGREIKAGEQPLKHAKPRRSRQQQRELFDDEGANEDDDSLGTALYAPFQTELYVPPPCVRGRVPRNAFGNLDVYVPSMVPPGGVHVRDTRARHAARLLGIDYADAVTGFTFRGRHGTAVVEGVVVAAEYGDALCAVLDGLRDLEQEDEQARRSREALRLWRKFLLGLRVLERVQEYASADEKKLKEKEMRDRIEAEEREEEERVRAEQQSMRAEEMAGGFLLAEGAEEKPAEPTARRMLAAAGYDEEYYDGGEGGGFLPDEGGNGEAEEAGEDHFRSGIMDSAPVRQRLSHHGLDGAGDDEESVGGGGFVPDEGGEFITEPESRPIPEDGGGFVPENGEGFPTDDGGGFLPDEIEVGGGFVREDTTPQPTAPLTQPEQQEDTQEQEVEAETPPAPPKVPEAMEFVHNEPGQQYGPAADNNEEPQSAKSIVQETGPAVDDHPQESNIGAQLDSGGDMQPLEAAAKQPEKVAEAEKEEQASSDEDMDSLPSHDPEDEDAEPEWLAEEVVSD